MASLELRDHIYRAVFRFRGRKYGYSLNTGDRQTAEGLLGGLERTLMLISQGVIQVPEDADIVAYFKSGGQTAEKPKPAPPPLTLGSLFDRYLETQAAGSLEDSSVATVRTQLGHLRRTFGERFAVRELTMGDLQRYVGERVKKKYQGRSLSAVTLRKEVNAFRACWNWGEAAGLLSGTFPSKGLVYPKADEKPPFMTREEIKKRIKPGISEAQVSELWECLYLDHEEITSLVEYVKEHARHPWVHPMVAFAAHTGARRSEILRAEVGDVDFDNGAVLIRERKRSSTHRTTRRVPLTTTLRELLEVWIAEHPGGDALFCHAGEVERSKKRSRTTGHQSGVGRAKTTAGRSASVTTRKPIACGPLTKDEVHHHLKKVLAGGEWEVVPGWHCFRHSFISACASVNTDQRLIDEWVGHSTDEQRRRYRHLYPSIQREAIDNVFG